MSNSISAKLLGVALAKVAVVFGIVYNGLQNSPFRVLLSKSNAKVGKEYIDLRKAANRYFIELLENPNLEDKLDQVTVLTGSEGKESKIEEFRNACHSLLDNRSWFFSGGLSTWCVSFVSIGDKLRAENKEVDSNSSDSRWKEKYQSFITSASADLKKILEILKSKYSHEEKQEERTAILWCKLLMGREEIKYPEFESKCIIKDKSQISS